MSIIAKLAAVLTLDNKKFKKGLKDSEKQSKAFGDSIKKIGGFIAGAFAADQLIKFGSEMVKLSHQSRGVGRAFDTLGIQLEDLQKATDFGVPALQLQKMAVQAKNLGLPVQDLAKYFEFATVRAAETGESVEYLVNSIVTGIGRKSPMILDNLGISMVDLQEETKRVGDFAKAAANIIEREMGNSTIAVEDATDAVTELATSWADLKLAVADTGIWDGLAGSLRAVARTLRGDLTTPVTELSDRNLEIFMKWAKDSNEAQYQIYKAEWERRQPDYQKLGESLFAGGTKPHQTSVPFAPGGGVGAVPKVKTTGMSDAEKAFENTLTATSDTVAGFWQEYTHNAGMAVNALVPLNKELDLNNELMANAVPIMRDFGETATEMQRIADVSGFVVAGISSIAQAAGQLLAGETSADVMEEFLGKLGGLMQQFGALLVSFGIGEIALKSGNPYVTIAAGAALIAIGAAIGSKRGQIQGSVGGGGTYGSYGGATGGGGMYTEQREIVMVARGKDLVTVLNKQNYEDNLGGP